MSPDLGASVRQLLLNQARAQERPFAEQFILKDAFLLTAWRAPISRATKDIDLLGRTSNELEHIRVLFAQLQELLQYYAVERFLYRLSKSRDCDIERRRPCCQSSSEVRLRSTPKRICHNEKKQTGDD